jgi:hypothetical protein
MVKRQALVKSAADMAPAMAQALPPPGVDELDPMTTKKSFREVFSIALHILGQMVGGPVQT